MITNANICTLIENHSQNRTSVASPLETGSPVNTFHCISNQAPMDEYTEPTHLE